MNRREYLKVATRLAKDDPAWVRRVVAARPTSLTDMHIKLLRIALRRAV